MVWVVYKKNSGGIRGQRKAVPVGYYQSLISAELRAKVETEKERSFQNNWGRAEWGRDQYYINLLTIEP